MEFAPWPYFEEDEIHAAVQVLKSGNVNQWTGNETISFEKEFARYVGTAYAVALANGSLALDLALAALDIGQGDEVIVTPRSFVASVSCVVLKGAVPVFVDVDATSQNITLETISQAVSPRTKAVIAVHLAGWPCELDKIKRFCEEKNIFLIEDCAQAHGAAFKGKKAGSFGDCAIFSFCQDKIMTTGGEGGMLVTDDKDIWEKVWCLKDHGKNYEKVFSENQNQGFKWFVDSFGTNCRMTELQAAMGRVMLRKLDGWVEKRRQLAALFDDAFQRLAGLRASIPGQDIYHSYYKYYVFVEPEQLKTGWDRDKVIKVLNDKGIPCNTGICPEIYLENAFENTQYQLTEPRTYNDISRLANAKKLGEDSIVFLVHPTLDTKAVQYVIDQVKSVMKNAAK